MSTDEDALSVSSDAAAKESATYQEALIKELMNLRNDQGATIPRVRSQPALLALGRKWRLSGQSHAANDASATRELLEQSVEALHARERDLLLAQFGFAYGQYNSRIKREQAYLKDAADGGNAGSLPSFARWSQKGICEIAAVMVGNIGDLRPFAVSEGEAEDGFTDASVANPRIRVESTEDFVRFGPTRIVLDRLCVVRFVMLESGRHARDVSFDYLSDRKEGVIEIIPQFGCEAQGGSTFEGGVAHMKLLTANLHRGETHSICYRMNFHTTVPICPPFISITPSSDADYAVLNLQFDDAAMPSVAWSFAGISHYKLLKEEYRKVSPMTFNGSQILRQKFDRTKAGLCYGITWDWRGA